MLKAERYYPKIKNLIYSLMTKYGVNEQNREDLYNTAYLGYLKSLKSYKKGKSSLVTWCYYGIRKELQLYCKLYYHTSGFSKHRTKVMPQEIVVCNDTIEQVHYNDPLQSLIDKECEEEIEKLEKK
jgi:DNA-directed RNA polymerase specialized sigma subunit